MKKFLFLIIVMMSLLIGCTNPAEPEQTTEVILNWAPSKEGSQAVRYLIEILVDDESTIQYTTGQDTTWNIKVGNGHSYVFRIAGIDARDRNGKFSVKSNKLIILN